MRMVLAEAFALAAAGVVLGVAGAVATTRLMAALLFGVTPTDPATFVSIAGILMAIALAGSYVPARRAARVDPMATLRSEYGGAHEVTHARNLFVAALLAVPAAALTQAPSDQIAPRSRQLRDRDQLGDRLVRSL
jgi:hypothetical protein